MHPTQSSKARSPTPRALHTVPVPGKLNRAAPATWPARREESLRPTESSRIYPCKGCSRAPPPTARPTPKASEETRPHPLLHPLPSLPPEDQLPRIGATSPSDSVSGGSSGLTHLALVALFFFVAEVDGRQARQVESTAPARARSCPQQEQRQQQQPRPPRWRQHRQPRAHDSCFGERAIKSRG